MKNMLGLLNRWYVHMAFVVTALGYLMVAGADDFGLLAGRTYFKGFRVAGYRIAGVSVYLAPVIFGFAPLLIAWMAKRLPFRRISNPNDGKTSKFLNPLFAILMIVPIIVLSYIAANEFGMDSPTAFLILLSAMIFYSPMAAFPEKCVFAFHIFTAFLFVTVFAGSAGPLFALLFLCAMYILLWCRYVLWILFGLIWATHRDNALSTSY